jgi:hypothetical protein
MSASTTDADGSGMFDDTLTDDENPFAGIGDGGLGGSSDSGGGGGSGGGLFGTIGAVLDPTRGADPATEGYLRWVPLTAGPTFLSDIADSVTGGERDANLPESVVFERPGDFPWIEEGSDSADLPLGSIRDPLNLDGGAPGPTDGAGEGGDTPTTNFGQQFADGLREAISALPWGSIAGFIALLGAVLIAINAFAGGLGEGVTDNG